MHHLECASHPVKLFGAEHRAVVIDQGDQRGTRAEVVSEVNRLACIIDECSIKRQLLIEMLLHRDLLQNLWQLIAGIIS